MPPFYDRKQRRGGGKKYIYDDIIANEPDYNLLKKSHISQDAIEFIKAALRKNANERATITQLLNMTWMTSTQEQSPADRQ